MGQLSKNRINVLIAGKFLEILNEREEQELEEWLSANPENRNFYDRIMQAHDNNDRNKYLESLKIDERWIQLKSYCLESTQKSRKINRYTWLSIAASIVIFLTIGLFWITNKQKAVVPEMVCITTPIPGSSKAMLITADGKQYVLQDTLQRITLSQHAQLISDGKKLSYEDVQTIIPEMPLKMNSIIVPRGGEYELVLPDQTKVYLNADSRLRFPDRFGNNKREVELEGEAYFKVSQDSLHPFIVRVVDRINVEVLGTEFNITAYPEDPIIATTLNRGAVRISDGTQNLKLHPDQQAVFFKNNGMIECREVDAKIYSAWTEGRIVLRNVTLEELMNRISRWYDLRINWYDEEIKNYHFTGEMLRYEKFSEILSMLEKATSVHFNIIGNLIEIRKR